MNSLTAARNASAEPVLAIIESTRLSALPCVSALSSGVSPSWRLSANSADAAPAWSRRASFANGEVYRSGNNGLTVINRGFHSQAAAPGFAMCYVWGIRHLDGDPWEKTRIDDPGYEWLWQPDANEHIYTPDGGENP